MTTFLMALGAFILLWFILGELQALFGIRSIRFRPGWLPVGGGFSWIPFVMLLSDHDWWDVDHEEKHEEQRSRDGYTRWTFRYITSAEWLLSYEMEAYRINARAHVRRGVASFRIILGILRVLYDKDTYWFWPWLERPPREGVKQRIRQMVKQVKEGNDE